MKILRHQLQTCSKSTGRDSLTTLDRAYTNFSRKNLATICAGFALFSFNFPQEPSLAANHEDKYGIRDPLNNSVEERPDSTDRIEKSKNEDEQGAVTSIDAVLTGQPTADTLRRVAEYCIKQGQYDKAIKYVQMALNKNYDDNDSHKVYAEALEQKLSTESSRDATVFNQCIKEWLIVMRQEVGDEKLTFHGLGVPGAGWLFQDENLAIPAKAHLKSLTGFTPKIWETDSRFLKKVLKPESTEVSGRILKNPQD